ncbi:hypothetical protein BFJ67_g15792 [Fusarium oxysporum f. sp. cepae]|nr:hypothetical protein BFJ67_g15792 [Fusarium oxysporum f. sp. cepae]
MLFDYILFRLEDEAEPILVSQELADGWGQEHLHTKLGKE